MVQESGLDVAETRSSVTTPRKSESESDRIGAYRFGDVIT